MLGFFCVNDNKNVDVKCLQTMTCIICSNNPIFFGNIKTQVGKGIYYNHDIQYNKWNNNIEKTCESKPLHYCKNV
jgi:hypothetical protein